MIDVEGDHLSLGTLYLLRVSLYVANQCLLLLQQGMLLGSALLQRHFSIDAILDILDLLTEGGDGGDDPTKLGIAFTGDVMAKLLVEPQELFLALLMEDGGVEDGCFLAAAGLAQLRFFHSEYNRE